MDKTSAIYANAFFDVAQSVKQEVEWRDQLESLAAAWRDTPEILRFFARTQISKTEKKEVLRASLGGSIDPTLLNALCLLVDKDRMGTFMEIVADYRHLYNAKNNIAEGLVYSVRPLNVNELESLDREFSQRINKTVRFTNKTDPTLISGIKIQLENKVMDGSMKYRISQLKTELVKGSR